MGTSLYGDIEHIYHFVRPYLPRKMGNFNGVVARRPRLLDVNKNNPTYKELLTGPLRYHCRRGDVVVNIGGGWGISMVVAANEVGPDGTVFCYEGSAEYVARCKETAKLNKVSETIQLKHAIVGENIDVWGTAGELVSPTDLPNCDILIMDCEGAEWSILQRLNQRPRVIIAEIHSQQGIEKTDIDQLLTDWGYNTETRPNSEITYNGPESNPTIVGVKSI